MLNSSFSLRNTGVGGLGFGTLGVGFLSRSPGCLQGRGGLGGCVAGYVGLSGSLVGSLFGCPLGGSVGSGGCGGVGCCCSCGFSLRASCVFTSGPSTSRCCGSALGGSLP